MTVRVVSFGYAGDVCTFLNLGFRGFDLFVACCVIICFAVSNVGNLVAAVGESVPAVSFTGLLPEPMVTPEPLTVVPASR